MTFRIDSDKNYEEHFNDKYFVAMEIETFAMEGLVKIVPDIFYDERGFFLESFQKERYRALGLPSFFVQDNHAYSQHNVLRGMHFQEGEGQAKLVYVVEGEIYDVAVDIRKQSPTYGQWQAVTLTGDGQEQFFIPRGFAHGYCVLSAYAHVIYKVDSLYHPQKEKGFRYDDPDIQIAWPIKDPMLSPKDCQAPYLRDLDYVGSRNGS